MGDLYCGGITVYKGDRTSSLPIWLGEIMVDYRRTLLRQRGEAGLQLHPFRKTQVALRNTTLNSPPPMVGKPRQAAIPITERTHDRIHTLPHTHLHAYSHSLIALLYISMSIPSELVELQLIDTQGKATTFYTYDGYYSPEDRAKISQYRKEVNKRTYTGAFIVGLAAYYTSRKTNMADFSCRSYRVRKRGLLSGLAGFTSSLLLLDYLGTLQTESFEKNIAQKSAHLPLWKSKWAAINPDRVYFELLDDQDNQPSIFHSGLQEEVQLGLPRLPQSSYPIRSSDQSHPSRRDRMVNRQLK